MAAAEPLVYVVDDEPDVRESLARLLRSDGWQVRAFGSGRDFLEALDPLALGCLLLDVNMPDMSGPELHEVLHARNVGLPIVYLTGRSSVPISVRAMKQGAIDFLEKPVDADALLPAIRSAVDRHRLIHERQLRQATTRQRLGQLTAREREVMDEVIRGRLNKQIAGDLGIAEKTVKVHRGRVMDKMRVRSVAELVRLCNELAQDGPAKVS